MAEGAMAEGARRVGSIAAGARRAAGAIAIVADARHVVACAARALYEALNKFRKFPFWHIFCLREVSHEHDVRYIIVSISAPAR